MESIRFLALDCRQCGFYETENQHICDLLIVRVAKLTVRTVPYADQSVNQLMVHVAELNDLISQLFTVVAGTSFALGILYKEVADVYETLGHMGKCVEMYEKIYPIVE